MKATIDRFGRVVVPKDMRDRLGLRPGAELNIEAHNKEIVIKQTEQESPLHIEDGVLVFAGTALGDITENIRRHREERIKKLSSIKRV
ncbi:MAG: AbrB family transcriptional regulator [Nitrospirae bacterium CG22_combo_CG10-13_8_21_14_all_44_11]|nr:MAG: AbrB family transcriptional regulator [Nitrospirae bacterium CG22_combo_CG10-13_8_21_14_all_44_11]